VVSAQGQVTWWPETYPTYDITHKKTKSKTSIFSMQTERLATSFKGFEQLSSSITWRVTELQSGMKMWAFEEQIFCTPVLMVFSLTNLFFLKISTECSSASLKILHSSLQVIRCLCKSLPYDVSWNFWWKKHFSCSYSTHTDLVYYCIGFKDLCEWHLFSK